MHEKEDSPKFVEMRGCIWMGKADTGIYSAASTSFRELCLAVTWTDISGNHQLPLLAADFSYRWSCIGKGIAKRWGREGRGEGRMKDEKIVWEIYSEIHAVPRIIFSHIIHSLIRIRRFFYNFLQYFLQLVPECPCPYHNLDCLLSGLIEEICKWTPTLHSLFLISIIIHTYTGNTQEWWYWLSEYCWWTLYCMLWKSALIQSCKYL